MLAINLPPEIEQYVHQAVANGRYPNEQEVVVDAIRLLQDSDLRYQQLRTEIREALASVDRGEGIEIDIDEELTAFFDEIEADVEAQLAAEKKEVG
jgi:antitoxin ParD1/3/4